MVDSDADSWYNWKGGDDINEMHTGNNAKTRSGVSLTSCDRSKNIASDVCQKEASESNGLIHYDEIPSSSRSSIHRYINPAIYAETLNDEDVEHEVEIRVKIGSKNDGRQIVANCGDSAEINDMMSTLSIDNDMAASYVDHTGDQNVSQETYRCYSLNLPTTSMPTGVVRSKSVTSCTPTNRVERRCRIAGTAEDNDELRSPRQIDSEVQRYMFNGHRIVQVSTSSMSSIRISDNRSNDSDFAAKKISYSEWMRRKQEIARRKKEEEDLIERQKQIEIERQAREKEERESRERENFLKWSERKKKEEEKKKAMVERELQLQRQLKEIEDKTAIVKTMYLRQWERKKMEQEKVRQKNEEMKKKRIEEEKKKRIAESSKAYENWRKMAKNKPRPATQGLLPHQKAKPAYVNPTPWQRIVDDPENDEEQDNASVVCRETQSHPRISTKRNTLSVIHRSSNK
ncbi:coiled-coil domain-containing protein 34-like [Ceratina calcarata]|uniref:Coiled-coil domain-containing protein 34-like n=1 Tax=Ceratina calcarata TaxID=156304 RepID=A0AAJ7J1B5_9HYME|nr:coiled-coil domain-containing protein 34-like [Ceratina calcarata]